MSLKTEVVRARIEPTTRDAAQDLLSKKGISLSDAIRSFLEYVVKHGGLPSDMKRKTRE